MSSINLSVCPSVCLSICQPPIHPSLRSTDANVRMIFHSTFLSIQFSHPSLCQSAQHTLHTHTQSLSFCTNFRFCLFSLLSFKISPSVPASLSLFSSIIFSRHLHLLLFSCFFCHDCLTWQLSLKITQVGCYDNVHR